MTTYGYAATHPWLATLTHDLAGTAYDAATTFTYNPAGQIKTRARNNDAYAWSEHVAVNRPYTVSRPNQTTQAGSGGTAVALAYDGRGNLTSSGTNTYQYTAENMLSRAPGGGELHYDPFERLEYESGSGVLFRSVGGEIATELNWSNQIVRRYVTGAGADEPLVLYDGAPSAATRSYLVADERGSVTAYTNASGTLTVLNRYDEYGIPGAANNGRFQYTGQAWLPSIGMYHYKARMYSPTLGRFMQTDPIGYAAGMNLYGYVGGDPVNATDPSGLDAACGVGAYQQFPSSVKSGASGASAADYNSSDILVTASYTCRSYNWYNPVPTGNATSPGANGPAYGGGTSTSTPQRGSLLRRAYRYFNPDVCQGKGSNEGAGNPAGIKPYDVNEGASLAALFGHVLPDHDFGGSFSDSRFLTGAILTTILTNPVRASGGSVRYTVNTGQNVGFDSKNQAYSDYLTVIMGPPAADGSRALKTAYPGYP